MGFTKIATKSQVAGGRSEFCYQNVAEKVQLQGNNENLDGNWREFLVPP